MALEGDSGSSKSKEHSKIEQAAIVRLATNKAVVEGEIELAVKVVTELAAGALRSERSSVWLFDQDGRTLICKDLFRCDINQHGNGDTLDVSEFPTYFAALNSGRAVDARDAANDPRTKEFADSYLKKYNIVSMLDAAIRVRGKLVGVLCNEAVGRSRDWSDEEIVFAADIADQVAQALINAERLEVLEALRNSEEIFRQLTENIREVFWLTSTDKKSVYYISPAFEQIWGQSCQSHIADPLAWISSVHLDDLDRVKAEVPKQIKGEYDIEFRIIRPDGAIRWIRDRAFPIFDTHGLVTRIAGIAEDITERKNAEQRKAEIESQLQQSQKMEALGELAGGIAHDFNNILSSIIGHTELLRNNLTRQPKLCRKAEIVLTGAYRAKDLVKQILTYARQSESKFQVVDVSDIIDEILKLIKVSLPSYVSLNYEVRCSCAVLADPSHLYQVFMNLCSNAVYAMKGRAGELRIILDQVYDEVEQKNYASVTVADQGHGIPDPIKDRIFDPYFTTKPLGEGTGLGLAVADGVVKNHGGKLSVESEVDQGTTFQVLLPIATNGHPLAKLKTDRYRNHTKVIVVDDEEVVASLAAEVLEHEGYIVSMFIDPMVALEFLRNHDDYSLLITDLAMPVMNGQDLARKAKVIRPDIKTIVCSGYDHSSMAEGIATDPSIDGRISKPFSLDTLVSEVNRILNDIDQPKGFSGDLNA